jgi:hypothetical protein
MQMQLQFAPQATLQWGGETTGAIFGVSVLALVVIVLLKSALAKREAIDSGAVSHEAAESDVQVPPHEIVIQRVGIALITIGSLDVLLMFVAFLARQSHSSPVFNFVLIAIGVYLVVRNLSAVRLSSWILMFLIVTVTGAHLAWLFVTPMDLLLLQWRTNLYLQVSALVFASVGIAVYWWGWRELQSPAIERALQDSGRRPVATKNPVVIGASLSAIFAIGLAIVLNGNAAQKAKENAMEQLGEQYSYHVKSIFWRSWGSGKREVVATVVAYDDTEFREIAVQVPWE